MQAWIYSPLQRIASDSSMYEGREGMERTGVGGKWSETNTASILKDHQTRSFYEGRFKGL